MANALGTVNLDPAAYSGGVGIWGALPAIYDTTNRPVEHGVHVHARRVVGRMKEIDESFSEVVVAAAGSTTTISEACATPYVAAAVLELPVASITCPGCGTPHLDDGRFAVNPHRFHVCQHCCLEFLEKERAIGNPIAAAKKALGDAAFTRPTKPGVPGPLRIDQGAAHASGGVLIWASNPAILWTARKDEADGIHVHTYRAGTDTPVVDDTYQRVEIDGIELHAAMTRIFMIQQSLPFIVPTLRSLSCHACGEAHFDDAFPFAVAPHRNHPCTKCGSLLFTTEAVISNPILETLSVLYAKASTAGLQKNPLAP